MEIDALKKTTPIDMWNVELDKFLVVYEEFMDAFNESLLVDAGKAGTGKKTASKGGAAKSGAAKSGAAKSGAAKSGAKNIKTKKNQSTKQ